MNPVGNAPPSRAVFRMRVPLNYVVDAVVQHFYVCVSIVKLPDKFKIVMVSWIIKVHSTLRLVIRCNFKWNNFKLIHSRRH